MLELMLRFLGHWSLFVIGCLSFGAYVEKILMLDYYRPSQYRRWIPLTCSIVFSMFP
jgi:hypothetical protein